MKLSDLRDILLRASTHTELTTKGSELTNTEVDTNFTTLYEGVRDMLLNHIVLPDYSALKTYKTDEFSVEEGIIYISLVDDNTNNTPSAPESEEFWAEATFAQIISINAEMLSEDLDLSNVEIYNVTNNTLTIPANKKYARQFILKADLYDPATTYAENAIVRSNGGYGGTNKLSYKSIVAGNLGFDLDNPTKWRVADNGGEATGCIDIASFGSSESSLASDHVSKFKVEDSSIQVRFISGDLESSPPAGEGEILLDLGTDVIVLGRAFLSLLNEDGLAIKQAAALIS